MSKEMNGVVFFEKILIDQAQYPNITEWTPKEIYLLPTGTIDNRPSFAITMVLGGYSAIGQFSYDTLRAALNEVGYDLVKRHKGFIENQTP